MSGITDANDLIRKGDAIEAVFRRICQIGMEADPQVLSIQQAILDIPAAAVTCSSCRYWEKIVPRSQYGEPGLGICRAHSDRGLNEPYIEETCDSFFCPDSEPREGDV